MTLGTWASDALLDYAIRDAADMWAGTHETLGQAVRDHLLTPGGSGGFKGKWESVGMELEAWSMVKHDPSRIMMAMVRMAAVDLFATVAESRWTLDA